MEIYRKSNQKYTMVSDVFIEEYMAEANGEFVKVYLLLLKGLSNEENITVSDLADCLQCTDKDIVRALNFWHDKGVLQLEWMGDELKGVMVLDLESVKKPQQVPSQVLESQPEKLSQIVMPEEKPVSKKRKQSFEDPEFAQLMYILQQYLGKPISPTEYQAFIHLYEDLEISIDILEVVIENSIKNNHKNIRYMESVAIDWHKNKVVTVEQAKERAVYMRKDVRAVMKAFGIFGRMLTDTEIAFVDKWYKELKIPQELIVEACKRTLVHTKNASFEYANRILMSWDNDNVKDLVGVKRSDEVFEEKKKKQEAKKVPTNFKTRFHNFEERDNDYDALVEEFNGYL
ncbi:hypothetical protein P261_01963 [Lachnospiraceae bacterium TWA4]|nr:hypothetical protein P261_01963 [Lachnospiraceae bacterium TWA4]